MGNAVVHFEIAGDDDGQLSDFYGELFGWRVETASGRAIDTLGGAGIGGAIGAGHHGRPSSTFFVESDNPQAIIDKVGELGGAVVMPVTDVDGGTRALFTDPDGLLVGLVGPGFAERDPSAGSGAPVVWFEVLGRDAAGSQRFYRDLFGWKVDNSALPDYAVVDTGAGRGIWGGVGGGVESRWAIVYVAVTDIEETLAQAEKLGGSRLAAPDAVALKNATRAALYGSADDMSMGWVRDPAGNVIGLSRKAPA